MAEQTATEEIKNTDPQARTVIYCGVCSLPPEYCEFGGTVKKCEEWLQQNHPSMWETIYNDESLSANLTPLSLDAQKRAEKDASKKAAKAAALDAAAETRRQTAKVQIKRVERNKRKFVTAITGLEAHGLDLKKVSKELGKRFATGASVTKIAGVAASGAGAGAGAGASAGAAEEIVLQGDLAYEIEEWVLENCKEVPEGNVEVVEDKKRKGGG